MMRRLHYIDLDQADTAITRGRRQHDRRRAEVEEALAAGDADQHAQEERPEGAGPVPPPSRRRGVFVSRTGRLAMWDAASWGGDTDTVRTHKRPFRAYDEGSPIASTTSSFSS